jgi:energy-coupling factor transporter ATP-binding protein EcfA2
MKTVVKDLTTRTKDFFSWIQRNFVFSVLVDCSLAHLIAVGKIVSSDIFVFSRAIEDAVDMALMKSRSEAELARMMTQINNMNELAQVWEDAKERNLLPCNLAPPSVAEHAVESHASMIVLRNLLYSRGTAIVRVDHLELEAGIYALTGANGSGKSTLFRVLMGCNTNERSIDLPPSIVLSTPFEPLIEEDDIEREVSCEAADKEYEEPSVSQSDTRELSENSVDAPLKPHPRLSITMPSSHVVEISQSFYWPLYTKPIDWIYQEHVTETCDGEELDMRVRRVAEELHSLEFAQSLVNSDEDKSTTDSGEVSDAPAGETVSGIMAQLLEEKEDWFNDLSGGQKSKVELVRKVFLQEECPHVLLVDETMAPLDPRSKALVMSKVKAFCSGSVVIVIYHTDVGREQEGEEGETVECVPSNDFFDGNIHVENKTIKLRPLC